jgi:hypothetical protein
MGPLAEAGTQDESKVDAVTAPTKIPLEWRPVSGDWEIVGPKHLIQKDQTATPSLILAETVNQTSYLFSCDVMKSKRSGAIILVFHYQSEDRWLCWTLGTRENSLSYLEYNQWQKGNIIDSTVISYGSDPGEWIKIKVFVDGLELKGYINDILRLDVKLPVGFPSFGYLVLGSWNTPVEFINVRARAQ